MIKKTMYFYDEKQAKMIRKINDKLHKKRGVKIKDADIDLKLKSGASNILKDAVKKYKEYASIAQNALGRINRAKDTSDIMDAINDIVHELPRDDMEDIRKLYYEAESRIEKAKEYNRLYPH